MKLPRMVCNDTAGYMEKQELIAYICGLILNVTLGYKSHFIIDGAIQSFIVSGYRTLGYRTVGYKSHFIIIDGAI